MNKNMSIILSEHFNLTEFTTSLVAVTRRIDNTPPLSAVAGRRDKRLLPSLGEAQAQRRLQNAAQMLLHEHPVKRAREAVASGAAKAKLAEFVAITNRYRPAA